MNFVHTSLVNHGIILLVKPQYIIWFLLHPIVKIPSPKKTATYVLSFLLYMHSICAEGMLPEALCGRQEYVP